MGKGKRSRENRMALPETPEKKTVGTKLSEFFSKKVVRIIATVLVIAILVGGFGYLAVTEIDKSTGASLRATVSVTSEHYEVNNAMVQYVFGTVYNEFYNQYYYLIGYMDLDTSKSLKLQKYGERTWFDFFMDSTVIRLEEMLLLAEGGLANGMSLTEEDKAEIDESIEEMKTVAKANGFTFSSYLTEAFGIGVKEKDVRAVMEIQTLASNYLEVLTDTYEFDKEDYAKYCEENRGEFYTMSYVYYKFDTAEQAAECVEKATSYDEFVNYIKNFAVEKAKAEAKEGTTVDEEEIKKAVDEDLKENTKEEYAWSDSTDLDKWLFADERKVGDVRADSTSAYWVLETQSRNDSLTRDVRHILVDTKEKAEELLNEWRTDPTVEKFTALVKDNSMDPGSVDNGGLYETVAPGDMVTEFNDWLFDEERKAGDSSVVYSESTGYHVMWYVGESDIAVWEAKADKSLEADAYDADYEKLEEAHKLTFDYALLSKIPG